MRLRFQLLLVAASGLVLSVPARGLPPAEAGSTACSCIDWWTTDILRVGNPNTLDRRDRTTARFDLSDFLSKGSVEKAELCMSLWYHGIADANGFVIHRLVRDREEIRPVDTLSQDVEELNRFVIRHGEKNPTARRIDVTKAVNGLLAAGYVQFVIRVRDATVEKRGNPDHHSEGANILKETLRLEVEP